jgi:hypothetical protein
MQVRNNEGELEVRMILQRGFPDEDAEVPPPTPWAPATFIAADMARVTSGPLERGTISFQRDEAGKPDRLDARLRVHPKLSDEVPADASTEGSSPGG